jgi:hypothetical protein
MYGNTLCIMKSGWAVGLGLNGDGLQDAKLMLEHWMEGPCAVRAV